MIPAFEYHVLYYNTISFYPIIRRRSMALGANTAMHCFHNTNSFYAIARLTVHSCRVDLLKLERSTRPWYLVVPVKPTVVFIQVIRKLPQQSQKQKQKNKVLMVPRRATDP